MQARGKKKSFFSLGIPDTKNDSCHPGGVFSRFQDRLLWEISGGRVDLPHLPGFPGKRLPGAEKTIQPMVGW